MVESSLLIIDEARRVHQLGIGMTGQGYLVATADTYADVIKLFSMRGVPRFIFASTSLPGYETFRRLMLKQRYPDDFTIIPIVPPKQADGGEALEIVEPCTAAKIRRMIHRLAGDR